MGKTEKPRNSANVKYPYAPVKVTNQQLARGRLHGEADSTMGTYAIGNPVFSDREETCRNDMKRLEFIRVLGQYYYGVFSKMYTSSCALLPAACQAGLRSIEDRVGHLRTPIVESSEQALLNLDCKVDSVCKIFKLRHEADIASDAKSRQTGASRMEESVQFLREHGLAGLARHAMALVMTHDGAVASSPAESRVLTDSTCQRDSWSHYAMSPVHKVLETAEPGIRYTQQVYGGAHRAIISSDTYNSAVDAAVDAVQRLQDTAIYRASARRIYPAISGVADPALDKLLKSAYTQALVEHLKPVTRQHCDPAPTLDAGKINIMSLAELADRANFLVSKYEKYIPDTSKGIERGKGKGAFEDLYIELLDQVNGLNLKAEEAGNELNRAFKAALNAELRKSKAALLEQDLPKLEKLVRRGKGLTKEAVDGRLQKVQQVRDGINNIPDSVSGTRKPRKPLSPLKGKERGRGEITINASASDGRQNNADYYKHTDASKQFQQEWEVAKARQDKALDNIEKGLGVLKGLGQAMGENLSQQDILLNEIDTKMDLANRTLKTNNMKLKGLVTQMRSSRNFCIDVALICILLAMGLWIWQLFKT